ncbi:SRPBCC family protein [Streptomyces sp. SAI-127]|uniref:SRPBCC family protein n=1 Tax=Streptomyces sp. SAI-127 TaxID=2940543 RepID=UPI002473A3E4|nr:SRPBCC family protein [Streptomyces sp. SAI-127]MDH6484064.1 carbon monoxide dehydrogenase subunit G [Streptomyces sp. SAI-127]
MKLENTLSIPVAVDDAWQVLLDVERVAPCVPGATLTASDGDEHRGRIKVKLGPIALTYSGTVTFLKRDEQAKVVVLEAGGREARGNGTAKALVTCRLSDAGGGRTAVHVETDLSITGKPAQFGRGTLAEVSGALMERFAGEPRRRNRGQLTRTGRAFTHSGALRRTTGPDRGHRRHGCQADGAARGRGPADPHARPPARPAPPR